MTDNHAGNEVQVTTYDDEILNKIADLTLCIKMQTQNSDLLLKACSTYADLFEKVLHRLEALENAK